MSERLIARAMRKGARAIIENSEVTPDSEIGDLAGHYAFDLIEATMIAHSENSGDDIVMSDFLDACMQVVYFTAKKMVEFGGAETDEIVSDMKLMMERVIDESASDGILYETAEPDEDDVAAVEENNFEDDDESPKVTH